VFADLGDTAASIAAAIAFLVPGFLAISTFEAFSPTIARDRSQWHWTMWSLTVSLILAAGLSGVYKELEWPRNAKDPEFYLGLFTVAVLGGILAGWLSRWELVRRLAKNLGLLQPRWIWFETLREPDRYVTVHLLDGSVIYGYPSKFTDDSREDVREVYLTEAQMLIKGESGQEDRWEKFPSTDGVLIESPRIRFIRLMAAERPSSEST
jgi:hypothetical protein